MKVMTMKPFPGPSKQIEDPLRPSMPVLDEIHRIIGDVDSGITGFLGLQHLFGSTAALVRKIAEHRIPAKNVFLVGKPYSTNPIVASYLKNGLGYGLNLENMDQPSEQENDARMDATIHETLENISANISGQGEFSKKRYLLIDDGGRAIKLLHSKKFAHIRRFFACVEQTRCGIRTIENIDLHIPVINVAESWVKLEHESPMIANSVNKEMVRKLQGLIRNGVPVSRKALVIGYGVIGQEVAKVLASTGREVAIFDNNSSRLKTAFSHGFQIFDKKKSALRRGGIIVGCTGLPIVGQDDYPDISHGSILISASSADVEFQAWNLRSGGECLGDPNRWTKGTLATPDTSPDPEGRRWDHPCFSLYRINKSGRCFYLVNGGFPVNFNGGVDPISPSLIQLTRTLLYIGAVQASHSTKPGLQKLNQNHQETLMELFKYSCSTKVA